MSKRASGNPCGSALVTTPYKVGTVITPILQLRELRLRDERHTAGQGSGLRFEAGLAGPRLGPEPPFTSLLSQATWDMPPAPSTLGGGEDSVSGSPEPLVSQTASQGSSSPPWPRQNAVTAQLPSHPGAGTQPSEGGVSGARLERLLCTKLPTAPAVETPGSEAWMAGAAQASVEKATTS